MKAQQLFTALALAASATLALAVEATQQEDPPSTATRAEVQAERDRASPDADFLMSGGEATAFVDRPVAAAPRTREEVRDQARVTAHSPSRELYTGGG